MDLTTSAGTTNPTTGQTSAGSTSDRSVVIDTPGFAGYYSAGYHLSDSMNAATFGQAQLTSGATASARYATVTFASIDPPIEDYLALYPEYVTSTSSKGSGTVTPQYGGIGGWQHTVVGATSRRTRLDYFAYGPATPVSAMPHTGVVKFSVLGSGTNAADSSLYFITGLNEIDVDFGAGTVSGSLTFSGSDFYNDTTGGIQGFNVPGTIVGNAVQGPISSAIADRSGRFHLLFIGPNADELIIVYVAADSRQTIAGSSVGVRNPYL